MLYTDIHTKNILVFNKWFNISIVWGYIIYFYILCNRVLCVLSFFFYIWPLSQVAYFIDWTCIHYVIRTDTLTHTDCHADTTRSLFIAEVPLESILKYCFLYCCCRWWRFCCRCCFVCSLYLLQLQLPHMVMGEPPPPPIRGICGSSGMGCGSNLHSHTRTQILCAWVYRKRSRCRLLRSPVASICCHRRFVRFIFFFSFFYFSFFLCVATFLLLLVEDLVYECGKLPYLVPSHQTPSSFYP